MLCLYPITPCHEFQTSESIWLQWSNIIVIWHTLAWRNLRKKSRRKDFPLRKAPATDIRTTFLFLISSLKSTLWRRFSSNSNVWSSLATTICSGRPDSGWPLAETETKQNLKCNNSEEIQWAYTYSCRCMLHKIL